MTQPTDPPATGQKTRRFIPLLRLVPDVIEPAPPRRRKGLRAPPIFTAEEQACLRASLRLGRHVLGSWKALAAVMRVNPDALQNLTHGKGKPVSAEIAVRLARALKVPLESLTTPGVRVVKDPCPTCGGAA